MISWLPYREISLFTSLTVDEVESRLSQVVIKRRFRWLPFSTDVGKFEGIVTADGFEINRVIGSRNSFLPILRGHFEALPNGTQVTVKMTLHPMVLLIVMLFCGTLLLGSLVSVLQGIGSFGGAAWMIGFMYVLVFVAFNPEANKATAFITQIIS